MSIASTRINSFLRIDQQSLQAEIERAMVETGLTFYLKRFHSLERTNNGHVGLKTFAEYHLPDLTVIGPSGESMVGMLRFRDSQIPGQAFSVSLGMFRLVCSNGLFGMSHATIQRIIHRAGPTNEGRLSGLVDAIKGAIGAVSLVQEKADDLADTLVADPIGLVASLNVPARVKDAVISSIAHGKYRMVDSPNTAWGLYNLVNEFDRALSRGFGAPTKRDESLADDIMALAMAEGGDK